MYLNETTVPMILTGAVVLIICAIYHYYDVQKVKKKWFELGVKMETASREIENKEQYKK